MLYVKGSFNHRNNGRSSSIMRKVRTRASREEDWLLYVAEFRKRFWGTSEMLTESDSGKVTKNCYLENILQSIDRNLTWLNEHPEVDKVVMLRAVIRRCNSEIKVLRNEGIAAHIEKDLEPSCDEYVETYAEEIRPELKSKLKKIKSDSRIATYLSSRETTKS